MFDFEQAKKPGRSGWVTRSITNSFLSDLLPGFNLNVTHDLWRGHGRVRHRAFRSVPPAAWTPASPISANTLPARSARSSGSAEGGRQEAGGAMRTSRATSAAVGAEGAARARSTTRRRHRSARRRPRLHRQLQLFPDAEPGRSRNQPAAGRGQNLGLNTSFSPTPFWSLSWSTQYDITHGNFEDHVVRLERDLHEWRAGFNFVRNA